MYKQATPIKYFAVFFIVILGVFAAYLSVRHITSTPAPPVKKYIVVEPDKDVFAEQPKTTENASAFSSDATTHPSEPNNTVDTEKPVIKKQSAVENPPSSEESETVVTDPNASSADETQNDNESHALSVQEQIDALKAKGVIPEGATVEIFPDGVPSDPDEQARNQLREFANGANLQPISRKKVASIVSKLETKDDPKWQEVASRIRAMLNHMPEGGSLMLNMDILPDDF